MWAVTGKISFTEGPPPLKLDDYSVHCGVNFSESLHQLAPCLIKKHSAQVAHLTQDTVVDVFMVIAGLISLELSRKICMHTGSSNQLQKPVF